MRYRPYYWIIQMILAVLIQAEGLSTSVARGPSFILEPPNHVSFYNTSGVIIPCSATGNPLPVVLWTDGLGNRLEDIPGLRRSRSDGSLIFSSFPVDQYQQSVHSTFYRCVASNTVGTIGSRDVHVRAVIYQDFKVQVHNGDVIRGNTGVLKCHVPNYLKDYTTITSWTRDDGHMIFSLHSYDSDSKYIFFPSGDLHIRNTQTSDSIRRYKCHVTDRLADRSVSSAISGRLIVRESHTTQAPLFVHFDKNVRTKEGSTVSLPCLAHGYPTPRYAWYVSDNGHMTIIDKDQRIDQVDGTLIIRRVTVKDAGLYFCMASNDVGQERRDVQLDVIATLEVLIHPDYQEVDSGNPAVINCTVKGYPILSVSWWKDERPLMADRRIMFPSPESLYINPTRQQDGGMYQCYVKNAEESAQGAASLIISAKPPVLKSRFPSQVVNPGSQVSLTCIAAGNPLPQITWSTYLEPVQDSNRVRVGDYVSKDGDVISFVNFTRIKIIDGGIYQCTAANDNGVVSHEARINVAGPPVIRPMKNKTVVGGTNVLLNCPVGGYPIKQITWEKGTRQLPLGRRHSLFPNGTLLISKIHRLEDQGRYACKAKGEDGRIAEQELHLRILVPPVITPFSFPAAPKEGIRTSVLCIVREGDPPIQITWLKDGVTLEPRMNLSVEQTNMFMSSLIIEKLQSDHSATYTCVASNEAAVVNYSSPLVVNSPPRWKVEPMDISVVIGSSAMLHCQAFGRPEPRVIWKKATDELSTQYHTVISGARIQTLVNGSLVIHQVLQNDQGKYMCEASNGVDSSLSTIVELNVHASPTFEVKFTSLTVKEGNSVSLTCEAHGDKPVYFVWYKDHQELQIERQQRYVLDAISSDDVTRSELIIYSANRADSGSYLCQAKNNWGSDDRSLQLQVLGIPDSPRKIEIKSVEARSITLSWSEPFDGNRPICKYMVQYKREESVDQQVEELVLESDQREITIRDLQPLTRYHFTLYAENDIGRSQSSDVVSATTDEEAPQDPPENVKIIETSSRSIKISWKTFSSKSERSRIKGFYVGYRIHDSNNPYVYKTVEQGVNMEQIDGLLSGRTYGIVVQPFNAKGAGPVSKEVLAQTLEFDPPKAVSVMVLSTTSSLVQLHWTRASEDTNPITGYIIHFRLKDGTTWSESQVSGDKNIHSVTGLQCGKTYQFFITAFNSLGRSDPSNIVIGTTKGSAPEAPSQHDLISYNSTSLTFNLGSWRDGGCTIQHFQLQYKVQSQMEWTVASSKIYPEQQVVVVSDLKPGTWYSVLVTAVNSASVVEEEYRVATLTLTGGVHSLDEPKGDAIPMANIEKQYDDANESAYFPSPYATTRVPVFSHEMMSREGAPGCRSLVRSSTRGHENSYDVPQPRRTKCKALFDQTSEHKAGSDASSDCDIVNDRLEGYEQPQKSIRPKNLETSIYPISSFKENKWSTPNYGTRSDCARSSIYSPIHLISSSIIHDGLEPSDTECDRDLPDNKKMVVKQRISSQCPSHQQLLSSR